MAVRKLAIATCKRRTDKIYKQGTTTWPQLMERLSEPQRTSETIGEYLSMSKDQQADIKDAGGFVLGVLQDGRRTAASIVSRSVIVLDADEATKDWLADLRLLGSPGYAMAMYSTHKHTPERPRLRILVPLSRDVGPEEYEYLARMVAQELDATMLSFDGTTYQPSRMMYWPTVAKDGEYVFETYDDPVLDVDRMLACHPEWRDVSTWPHSSRVDKLVKREMKRLGDPGSKQGWIGAFCRVYTVQLAIEKYIPDIYVPTAKPDRWTYAEGSTAGGLVIYDERLAYSNHSTDPAGDGHVHNAFDLVRIHLFGELDADAKANTAATALPSYEAMVQMVAQDNDTRIELARDDAAKAVEEFADDLPEATDKSGQGGQEEADKEWMAELDRDKHGRLRATINNAALIIKHDQRLADAIRLDDFSQLTVAIADLPWRKVDRGTRAFNDRDAASLRLYLETRYGLTGKSNIEDAVADFLQRNRIHPVRDYLKRLKWDGVKRAETIFIDFLGAADTAYVRTVTRVFLRAAIMRVLQPGCKYDNMPILIGPQGIGKSTILQRLGREWFSDSLKDFKGKDAMELIQGTWIMEVGELAALRKAEVEDIKQFLSSREDKFRPAYGRKADLYPRQCVMIGTSNKPDIFRDMTGNRRFWPIDLVADETRRRRFFTEFDDRYVDQVWAEALTWKAQELYLPYEIEKDAEAIQAEHMEVNVYADKIRDYLDTPITDDWERMSLEDRRDYYADPSAIADRGTRERTKVCVREILAEVFNTPDHKIDNYRAKEINDVLRSFDDWEYKGSMRFYGPYGRGRGYVRKSSKF